MCFWRRHGQFVTYQRAKMEEEGECTDFPPSFRFEVTSTCFAFNLKRGSRQNDGNKEGRTNEEGKEFPTGAVVECK